MPLMSCHAQVGVDFSSDNFVVNDVKEEEHVFCLSMLVFKSLQC